MSAIFVITGHAGDRNYAKTEMLADALSQDLPDFRVTKEMKRVSDWPAWLATLNDTNGWNHQESTLIYRLLGEGNTAGSLIGSGATLSPYPRLIGDYDAFAKYAKDYYGMERDMSADEIDDVVKGNLEAAEADVRSYAAADPRTAVKVCVHKAASIVAYHLLWRLGRGEVFGPDVVLDLVLLDDFDLRERVRGVQLELQDCVLPAVGSVTCTADLNVLNQADVVVVVSGKFGAREGAGLSSFSVEDMTKIGYVLSLGSGSPKVLVAGEGCNAAATLIAMKAPSLPKQNITTLTRIDEARAKACIAHNLSERVDAAELKINGADVHNVVVWGGDSAETTPDVTSAVVTNYGAVVGGGASSAVNAVLRNEGFVRDGPATRDLRGKLKPDELIGWVRERDLRLQAARKGYAPAMLVAKLIADHLEAWCGSGEASAHFASVGLWSSGNTYGAPEGLFFSFPAKVVDGNYTVVEGLPIPVATRLEINKIGLEVKTGADRTLAAAKLPETASWTPIEPPKPPPTDEEGGEDGDGGDTA